MLKEAIRVAGQKNAVLFARPAEDAAKFEPLERMRAIIGNVLCCLSAAMPDTAWQVRFSCFFAQPAGPLEAWSTSSESVDAESIHRYIPAGKAREP